MAMSMAPTPHSFGQDQSLHRSVLTAADNGVTMSAKKTTDTVNMSFIRFSQISDGAMSQH